MLHPGGSLIVRRRSIQPLSLLLYAFENSAWSQVSVLQE